MIRPVVPEAPLEETEAGLVPAGEGWFVLNAQEAHWRHREGRGKSLPFEGPTDFPQVGITLFVLGPGEPIGMYHWEADQEDFLVLSGEGLLIVEGEERPLRPVGLRALSRRDEAHHYRSRSHALRRARGRRTRASGGQRLGRLHGRRGSAPARRRGRAEDKRRGPGVQPVPGARADAIPDGWLPTDS